MSTAIIVTAAALIGGVVAAVGERDSSAVHATDGERRPFLAPPSADSTEVSAAETVSTALSDAPRPKQGLRRDVLPEGDGGTETIVPERGSGKFIVVPGGSDTAGSGALVTYSVEVESDLEFPRAAAARLVERTLADQRGWTAVADRSLRRVSVNPMIRIRIATPNSADALCAPLDTGGRLSCRNGENVVLNAWRWANGADGYEGDLGNYRRYMINHEVGHALGFGHTACPGPGRIAPTMLQQTKGLQGCTPNPWPVLGAKR